MAQFSSMSTRTLFEPRYSTIWYRSFKWLLLFHVLIVVITRNLGGALAFRDNYRHPDCAPGRPFTQTRNGMYCGIRKEVKWPDKPASTVQIYYGIKYGKDPINNLRFRKPEAVEPTPDKLYQADKPGTTCHQLKDPFYNSSKAALMWVPQNHMGEDCLVLNVWKPDQEPGTKKSEKLLPVMVWIYGGGFFGGTSTLKIYDGEFLAARQNVIVASMNYRLGAFGFMYLGEERMPGNVGLWDQRLAIKWVRDNVHYFGGNPDQITIFGESAGSVSVSAHVISPWSHAFFRNAIMQSGTFLGYWGLVDRVDAKRNTLKFLRERLNCPINRGNDAMLRCLATKSTQAISNAHGNFFNLKSYFNVPFPPVLDDHFFPYQASQAFRHINHIKPTGALLLGINKNEASYFLLYAFVDSDGYNKGNRTLIIRNQRDYTEKMIKALDLYDPELSDMAEMVVKYTNFEYTNYDEKETSENLVARLEALSSDRTFKCPTIELARAAINEHRVSKGPGRRTQTLPVYFYEFHYRTKSVPWPEWMGMIHGYEIEYVFGIPYSPQFQAEFYNFTDEERVFSDKVMTYWANFARTGDPNIMPDGSHVRDVNPQMWEWPAFDNVTEAHIVFQHNRTLSSGYKPRHRQCMFWQKWYPVILSQAVQKARSNAKFCRHGKRSASMEYSASRFNNASFLHSVSSLLLLHVPLVLFYSLYCS